MRNLRLCSFLNKLRYFSKDFTSDFSMGLSFEKLLTKANLEGFENPKIYQEDWVPLIKEYQEKLAKSIPEEHKIKLPGTIEELKKEGFNSVDFLYSQKLLSEEEFRITDTSATELAREIADGKYSSVKVFSAFAKRASICCQLTNCTMELFLDEGMERAKQLDAYYEKHGKTVGPFHGLPISLKEQMGFRNKITHGGYVSYLRNVPKEHAVTVQILEDLGAIFYVRTNEPQSLMHIDSENNIVGAARNPYNLGLTPGGSSSGEGSIVGFGGSAIGMGSDIAGSIRCPAVFSGCYGLKPTTLRVSTLGGVSSNLGQESIPAVMGPMTRNVGDIDFWLKHYFNQGKPWDRDGFSVRIPWRDVLPPEAKNLTIAVLYDNDIVKPTPPIKRGLDETVKKLKASGVNVVEFKPIKMKELYDTALEMYSCDGCKRQKLMLSASGEPLLKLTKWALNFGEGTRELLVLENRQLNFIKTNLKVEYNKFLNDNKIDFILAPANSNVAPKPARAYDMSYTILFNLIDFPSLAFPTGLYQDPKIDVWSSEYPIPSSRNPMESLIHDDYSPEVYKGAPIGLQVAGRRFYDEEVVAVGKTIAKILA